MAGWNPFARQQTQPGLNLGGADPNAAYQMPQVPWGQNDAVTAAAFGLLGGRTLNEGLQNAAQMVPAGLASNTAKRRDMYTLQESATKRAAMNAAIKIKSNQPLTAADKAALEAAPEVMLQFGMPAQPDWIEIGGRPFNKTTGTFGEQPGGGGGFTGTGLDAQDSQIIVRGQTDDAYRNTPEFKIAWSRQFETPKMVMGDDGTMVPILPSIPAGLKGPAGGSVATPASPDQTVPTPTDATGTGVRTGKPVVTGTKTPEAVRTAIIKAETYKKSLDTNLDAYAAAIKEGGISAFPGVEQDRLNTLRNQILLDLKELNVLGVLAGPDMDIMNGMIYNPVLGSGGIGTTLDQMATGALGGTFGISTAEQRAAANTKQLKDMLAGKVNAWKSANAAGTAPSTGGSIPLDEFMSTP